MCGGAGRAAAGRRRRGTAPRGFRADAGGRCARRAAEHAVAFTGGARIVRAIGRRARAAARPRRSRRCRRMRGASCASGAKREWVVPVAIACGCRRARLERQCRTAGRDRGNRGARQVRAVRAVWRHRQRQDRGLPRGSGAADRAGRPGAAAGSGDQPHTPARTARPRRVARRAVAVLHSGLASGETRAALASRRAGEARLVLGTRLAVFAPMPRLGAGRRRRGARSFVQAAGNVRYHARDVAMWRAQRRDVPVVLGSATPSLETWLHAMRRPVPGARPAAARRSPGARCRGAIRRNRPARALEGIGAALREALGSSPGARRAVAGVHQSPRLRAVAAVLGLRLGSGLSALQRAAAVHRDRRRCAATTAGRKRRAGGCPTCGKWTCCRWATARSGSNASLADLSGGAHRCASTATAPARKRRLRRDARAMDAGEVDILGRHADARQGPRFPAPDAGRRARRGQRAVQRRLSRHRAPRCAAHQVAGRAGRAGCAGEVIVQTDFPDHPLYAALRAHDYARLAETLLAERKVAELPPFTHVAVLRGGSAPAQRRRRFLRAAHAAGMALAGGRARRSRSFRRSRRCSRDAPDSSAARCVVQSARGRRCSNSFRRGARHWPPARTTRALGARRGSAGFA